MFRSPYCSASNGRSLVLKDSTPVISYCLVQLLASNDASDKEVSIDLMKKPSSSPGSRTLWILLLIIPDTKSLSSFFIPERPILRLLEGIFSNGYSISPDIDLTVPFIVSEVFH